MLNNGGGEQQQLSGCLKLEKVFYLLQNTAPNSKAIDKLRRYACHALRLIGFDCYGKP